MAPGKGEMKGRKSRLSWGEPFYQEKGRFSGESVLPTLSCGLRSLPAGATNQGKTAAVLAGKVGCSEGSSSRHHCRAWPLPVRGRSIRTRTDVPSLPEIASRFNTTAHQEQLGHGRHRRLKILGELFKSAGSSLAQTELVQVAVQTSWFL